MKLLVTRPALDAGPLVALLDADGHAVLAEPLLTIRLRESATLELDGVVALLFTSGNGVRAFAALSDRRNIPAFAVGDRTAAVAREQGFGTVESADGDVAALAALVATHLKPGDGVLLHAAGSEVAGDLAESLGTAGFTYRRAVLYEAEPATALKAETRAALADGTLDGVLLFSPRTARQFAELVRASGLKTDRLTAWCLSPAVAEALGPLPLRAVEVAPEPTQAALLSLIPKARPEEDVLTAAPDQAAPDPKHAPSPKSEPTDEIDPLPPAPKQAAKKPHWRRTLPLFASGAAILIAAGVIALFTPQIKERLIATRLFQTKPVASVAETRPAPAELKGTEPQGTEPQETPSAPTAPAPSPTLPSATSTAAVDQTPAVPSETAAPPAANPGAIAPSHPVTAQSAPEPSEAAPAGVDTARIDRLQDTIGALQQRLAAVETKPAADPASVQTVAAGLADAVGRIARLEAQMQRQAVAQRNEKAMILALAEIKDRIAGSGPFDGPLAVLKASAGNDPAAAPSLAVLERFADHGVESRAALAAELDGLPAAINVPPAPSADAGLWQHIEARARRLVSIRRVDDSGGDKLPPGPDRSLAVAAAALKAGDLSGALDAIKALDGQPAEVARPWLTAARDRLAVEQAADRLMTLATQRLDATAAQEQAKPQ
ncbi:hypothetical protein GCM10011611_41390 [Aliidongia dinghuensis]|uniref:Tetrapyrrole biosynthesis uroporphyrinogen III synthase domain-containing protein n=1 Tax=Aliidongia dinghuensis TaxID=1867774 RepID=A0A8J3E5B6_9PROT|nr:uroporphyrinogen-III synthase [Aliidongia dinghuensis]GGF30998.1 hypothetical protein GCM10011611_41390 [Aliidongia dinghuensis]